MNTKRLLYSALAGLVMLVSCTKDEMGPVILENPTAPIITAPAAGMNIEITESNFGDVLNFEWKAADYGFIAAIAYTVQAGLSGSAFAEPIELFKANS